MDFLQSFIFENGISIPMCAIMRISGKHTIITAVDDVPMYVKHVTVTRVDNT